MKLFVTKKKLIKHLAEELAYLQIRADWWYYCYKHEFVDETCETTKEDMSSHQLEYVTEVRNIAKRLDILKDVYAEAYKIYDFRNSGKAGFEPDITLIEKLNREFCEPIKKKRLLF